MKCLDSRAGKTDDALATHQRVLAIQMKTLGPAHLQTTQTQVNLAMALRTKLRCTEALPLLEAARETRIKLFGAEHPDVVRVLHTLGDCYVDLGRAKEALEPLERVLKLAESKPPKTVDERVSLAMARYAFARALWEGGGSKLRATELVRAAHADLVELKDARASGPAEWAAKRKIKLAR